MTTRSDYQLGRFSLRASERQLLADGAEVPLGGRAFDVLVALVDRAGQLVSKEELLERAWPGVVVEENNLQVQVSMLRRALGQAAIETVPGRGYRLTLEVSEKCPSAPQPASLRKHNLPRPLTNFIGHERDLLDCAQMLERTRLLTLIGIGGCGKTRFAIKLAEQVLPSFREGVWFVDLAPLADAAHVPFTIATRLGLRETPAVSVEEVLCNQLADRQLLLVLDNCEHLLESCAHLAQRLLEAAPGLRILATSRESLGVAGEQIVTVRSLVAPAPSADHDIELLKKCEAVRLFVERAQLVMPTFRLAAELGAGVGDICRRLDGIPLAIELAAARVNVLSVEQIRSRLNDRFRLLIGGARALPRHRTLGAVLQWSYEHLGARERQLIRRLSVFAGGWTLDAALAMAASPSEHADVPTMLSGLVDKSLVEVERHGSGEPRYRMLETVRQYMIDRLEEIGETGLARARHLQFFVELAEAVYEREYAGNALGSFVPKLDHERDNLLAAHACCDVVEGGAELGLRLVNAVLGYWLERRWRFGFPPTDQDPIALGYRLMTEALARPGAQAPTMYRCRCLFGASNLSYMMRRYEEAETYLEESTTLARELGDDRILAARLGMLAYFHQLREDFPSAHERAEEALSVARRSADRRAIAIALLRLGDVCLAQGAVADAEELLSQSVAFARDSCPRVTVAALLVELTWALVGQGCSERAARALHEALPAIEESGDMHRGSTFLVAAGSVALSYKDYELAARFCGAAQAHGSDGPVAPEEQARLAQVLLAVEQRTERAICQAAEAAGRTLTYSDALANARVWLERTCSSIAP